MKEKNPIQLENAASMSEIERLEAMFFNITNTAIQNLENNLAVAEAMGDQANKKVYHIQIGMFRHAQSIFQFSKQYASDKRWKNDDPTQ